MGKLPDLRLEAPLVINVATGSLPTHWSLLAGLRGLDVSSNNLTGMS